MNLKAKKTSFFIRDILGESNTETESKFSESSIEKENQTIFCEQNNENDFAKEYKEKYHRHKNVATEQHTEFGNRQRSPNHYEKEKRYIISTEYYPQINNDHQGYIDPILMTPSPDSDFDLHEKFRSSPRTISSNPSKLNPEVLLDFPENPLYRKYPQDYHDIIIQSHNQSIANLRYLCSLQAGFNAKISPFLYGNHALKTHANTSEPCLNQNYLSPENQFESRHTQWSDMQDLSRNLNEDRHALFDNTPSPSPNLLSPNSPTISSPNLGSQERRHFPAYLRTVNDSCKDPKDSSPTRKPKKCRRSRTVFTEMQMIGLEKRFENQQYLSTPNRVELADLLGLTQLQVKTWYQNRRMKWKKQVLQCGGTEPPTKPKGRPRKIRPEDKSSIL